MFGWRRRSEGFEWREYVRTTVLVRRRDRQKRVDDALVAAVENVQQAKERGLEAGREGLKRASDGAANAVGRAGGAIGNAIFTGAGMAADLGAGAWRAAANHFRIERTGAPASPTEVKRRDDAAREREEKIREIRAEQERAIRRRADVKADATDLSPDAPRVFHISGKHIAVGLACLAVVYVAGPILTGEGSLQLGSRDGGSSSVVTGSLSSVLTIEPSELTGRASALTGGAIRINGQNFHLAGVEAPETGQPCLKGNSRRWPCADAAEAALERILRGKRVTCLPAGKDDAGHALATCKTGDIDIGGEMVRRGHVFAAEGVIAPYKTAEIEARSESLGIWQGEVSRPETWRSTVWEEAKRNAPDGCPIKGSVRSSSRTYAMPWHRAYEATKLRPERGDRWFCSENEAREAGFSPADGA